VNKNKLGIIHLLPLVLIGVVLVIGPIVFLAWQNEGVIQEQLPVEKVDNRETYQGEGFRFKHTASTFVEDKTDKNRSLFVTVRNEHGNSCVEISVEPISATQNILYIENRNIEIGGVVSYEYPGYLSQEGDDAIYADEWTRLEDRMIAGQLWHTWEIRNNYENHGLPIDYSYVDDTNLWVIEIISSDAFCETDFVNNILDSFEFTD